MPNFRTTDEQRKWDAIQDEGRLLIDRLMQGNASPEDIRALSAIISQQSALAGQVFDEMTQGAESTADSIIDRLNRERIEQGKRPLTLKALERLFRTTHRDVLRQSTEDILDAVRDAIEQAEQRRTRTIDRVLRRRPLPGQDEEGGPQPPTPEPPRPREEEPPQQNRTMLQRILDSVDRARASVNTMGGNLVRGFRRIPTRSRELVEQGRERVRRGGRGLLDMLRNPRAAMRTISTNITNTANKVSDYIKQGWARLTRRNADREDEESRASIWLRKLRNMYGGAKSRIKSAAQKATGLVSKILGPLGKILLLSLTNPQLIKSIAEQVKKYLNFDTISTFVSDTWKDVKNSGSQILDWIIDKVKKYFTLDNAKSMASKGYEAAKSGVSTVGNWMASTASRAADSTLNFLGMGPKKPAALSTQTAPATKAATPEVKILQQKVEIAKRDLSSSRARYKADPSDANKARVIQAEKTLTILQTQLMKANTQAAETQSAVRTATSVATPVAAKGGDVAPVATSGGPTATGPAPADVRTQSMSSAPTTTMTAPSFGGASPSAILKASSASVPVDLPKFKDGVAVGPVNSAQDTATANNTTRRGTIHAGTVTLGSTGYQSSDDTLNLLNMGLIG